MWVGFHGNSRDLLDVSVLSFCAAGIAEKLNQLEKEAEEAERVAREARTKAQLLRDELCMLVTL